jgi:hypothetical protein
MYRHDSTETRHHDDVSLRQRTNYRQMRERERESKTNYMIIISKLRTLYDVNGAHTTACNMRARKKTAQATNTNNIQRLYTNTLSVENSRSLQQKPETKRIILKRSNHSLTHQTQASLLIFTLHLRFFLLRRIYFESIGQYLPIKNNNKNNNAKY